MDDYEARYGAWDAYRYQIGEWAFYCLYEEDGPKVGHLSELPDGQGWDAQASKPDGSTLTERFSDSRLIEAITWVNAASGVDAPLPQTVLSKLPVEGSAQFEGRTLSDGSTPPEIV